ncbi:MAG: phosphoadenosine phosphosulfate reductase family protein, partial [Phaeodactylibacter sp.]|nr:phosphoadenosine phosphosulfate reductase family protein [Phaeodactylibacter sp.]
MEPENIIFEAVRKYHPVHALLMISGGHDSVSAATRSVAALDELRIPYSAYHGDTGTGIVETQEYVKDMCLRQGWQLDIRKPEPPYDYESYVRKYGFPGPAQHQNIMRNLKEKPLRKFITHEIKSTPYARENVLLITGIRKSESLIRMGYTETTRKDNSRVWCSPIFYYSAEDVDMWMKTNSIPRNPVKDRICISGECLCGCFAKPEEGAEIKAAYPDAWEKLQKLAKHSPWKWGQDP